MLYVEYSTLGVVESTIQHEMKSSASIDLETTSRVLYYTYSMTNTAISITNNDM